MIFLLGRGLFVLLFVWMVSFFLIWQQISQGLYSKCLAIPHSSIDLKSRIFLDPPRKSFSKFHTIPVHIVEEHHEVIKYWFAAVEKNYIAAKSNVLFHIDAHSDGGTPDRWDLGPLFRKPKGLSEIRKMMQGNDRFVMAAVLQGLITRYIWVWPPWVNDSAEEQTNYERISIDLKIGTTQTENETGTMALELCACATSTVYNLDNYCFMNNASDFEDVDGIPIVASRCEMKSSLLIEVMTPGKAVELLKSGTWITEKDSVILDVDEDYYGVEPGGKPLYDLGVTDAQIDTISDWMGILMCAGNTRHEKQIDRFFRSLIEMIIDVKKSYSHRNDTGTSILKHNLKHVVSRVLKMIHSKRVARLLCGSWKQAIRAIKLLVRKLVKLTEAQLKALIKVGLCLEESPKTFGFEYGQNIRICNGYNTPNETMVMFYTPSDKDIRERTSEIEKILRQEFFSPGVVTICRSVRDGYTPRNLARNIESEILRVLEKQYSRIVSQSVFYDSDLLSGPMGHFDRY